MTRKVLLTWAAAGAVWIGILCLVSSAGVRLSEWHNTGWSGEPGAYFCFYKHPPTGRNTFTTRPDLPCGATPWE
jgi:hypothetical protein